jgi:hypothetical protein
MTVNRIKFAIQERSLSSTSTEFLTLQKWLTHVCSQTLLQKLITSCLIVVDAC